MVQVFYDQDGFGARFEWGIEGVRRLGPLSDVLVSDHSRPTVSRAACCEAARGGCASDPSVEDADGAVPRPGYRRIRIFLRWRSFADPMAAVRPPWRSSCPQ